MRENKKQKQAYGELIRSTKPLTPGERLPVYELPEVQRQERKEFKRMAPLFKRVGEVALLGLAKLDFSIWGYISGLPKNDPESMKKAGDEYARTGRGNYAAYLATSRMPRIVERRSERRKKASDKAVSKFREAHPNVTIREAELHKDWKKGEAARRHSTLFSKIVNKSNYAVEYFSRKRAYSFSKAIPTRGEGFDGSYQELAKSALSDALNHQREDGKIPLLGMGAEKMRFAAHEAAGDSPREIWQSEKSYVEGASTALWKLGFVEFDSEDSLRYGKGRFNPDIEWGKPEDSHPGFTASLAFDPDNELHQMLAPDRAALSNPRIEVYTSYDIDSYPAPHLGLRVIEAAETTGAQPAVAMAA